jgi:hypothetical protein
MSQRTKIIDSFATVLAPGLCADTDTFLDAYRGGIQRTKEVDRVRALKRFKVEEIHGNKSCQRLSQHEFAVVVVRDTTTEKKYNFIFERNAVSSKSKTELKVSHYFFIERN